ncbi:MAG: hypothetical protein EHM81_01990 [Chloroflexi bacterium]|nr:MAG: hypothetical protein EHM81_01990 [Chloroflexota bacterium]
MAPDSGIPDANWEKFDPPPEVTHFKISDGVLKDLADLDFFRRYLAGNNPARNPGQFSFRLGYFFHLITDNLWTVLIGRPTHARYGEQFAANPKFIWEVKDDWYGLDFIYVRDHPQSLFWRVFLAAQPDGFDLDFLPRHALEHQINHIKTFYQRQDDEIQAAYKRPYVYLSQAEVDSFVAESTDRIFRIYHLLWPTPPNLTGKITALELL